MFRFALKAAWDTTLWIGMGAFIWLSGDGLTIILACGYGLAVSLMLTAHQVFEPEGD